MYTTANCPDVHNANPNASPGCAKLKDFQDTHEHAATEEEGLNRSGAHQGMDDGFGDGLFQLCPHVGDVGRHMDGNLPQVGVSWWQIVIHDIAHGPPCIINTALDVASEVSVGRSFCQDKPGSAANWKLMLPSSKGSLSQSVQHQGKTWRKGGGKVLGFGIYPLCHQALQVSAH